MESLEGTVGWLLKDMARMTAELARLYVSPNDGHNDWELTIQEDRVIDQLRRLDKLVNPGGGDTWFDMYEDEVLQYHATRTYLNFKTEDRTPLGRELFVKHSEKISAIPDLKQAVIETNLTEFGKMVGIEDKSDVADLKIYLLRERFGNPPRPVVFERDPLN